jgi:hypothetical protein
MNFAHNIYVTSIGTNDGLSIKQLAEGTRIIVPGSLGFVGSGPLSRPAAASSLLKFSAAAINIVRVLLIEFAPGGECSLRSEALCAA